MTGQAMRGFGKTIAGSAIFHAALISIAVFVFGSGTEKVFIAPVYTVDLVDEPGPGRRKAAEAARQPAQAKEEPPAAVPPKETAEKTVPAPKKSAAETVQVKGKDASVDEALKGISERLEKRKDEELVTSSVEEIRRKREADKERKERLERLMEELGARQAAPQAEPRAAPGARPAQPPELAKGGSLKPAIEDKYPAYFGIIRHRVQQNWAYPQELKDSSISVIVSIKIARSGKVIEASVEKSSGNPVFDESLLSAVWKASPFPQLPQEFEGGFLETGLRFCPGCV